MFNKGFLLLGILSLAACGGGSPGPIPTPQATNPPVTYSVHLKFSGGTSLRSSQSLHRGATMVYAHAMDVTLGQLPIELSVAPLPGTQQEQDSRNFGAVTVVVAPMPSASPAISMASNGVTLTVGPNPYPSPGPTDAPRFNVTSQSGITAPTSGTFSATVGAPVNSTDTIPVYIVSRANLACGSRQLYGNDEKIHPSDQTAAIQFVNGVAQATTDLTHADFYMDGPQCTVTGFQNSSESETTFHTPFGAVYASSPNAPFATLTPAAWTNSFTSFTYSSFVASLTAPYPAPPTDELLLKTQDGHIVKIAFWDAGMIGTQELIWTNFAYQEDGFSIDGF